MERSEALSPRAVRWTPDTPSGTAALVLAGSSGRLDSDRAELLARHGVTAESIRWFGASRQQSAPWEVPLEVFTSRVDDLARDHDRVVLVGTSFGAEAALVVGARHPGVDAVVAFAPTDVVWAGIRPDGGTTSHWTDDGVALPHVPFDDTWVPASDPPAYLGLYETSRIRSPEQVAAATIPVERIDEVMVVAGGDDRVWPSLTMARAIAARRERSGRSTVLVSDPEAGHRAVLPGETTVTGGTAMQRGGNDVADRRLGAAAWPELLRILRPTRTAP